LVAEADRPELPIIKMAFECDSEPVPSKSLLSHFLKIQFYGIFLMKKNGDNYSTKL
jgi:hypothetical protein